MSPLSFEQNNELEARKALIRRHISHGFSDDEITGFLGISKKVLRETVKLICEEDNEYLMKEKGKEISMDVRTLKNRLLEVYKNSKLMFNNIKDDNNISVRDKTDLLRFIGEISMAVMKVEMEGANLVRSRLPANFTEMATNVEQYKEINELEDKKLPEEEPKDEEHERLIKKDDVDSQKVF